MSKKEIMESAIDIPSNYLVLVKSILENFLPGVEVWAYGSRVKGKAKKSSDLDLVVFGDTANQMGNLKIAFEESDLPFRVDVLNWNEIPESFRETIREKYIVIQSSGQEKPSHTR